MSRHFLILANQAIKNKAHRWIDAVPFGTRFELREAKRSNEQNARMWAMLGDISRQVTHQGRRYDSDRWKVLFLYALGQETEFLPSLDGVSFVPYGPRSSELSVAEMSEMTELMSAWGTERGVIFHDTTHETEAAE
jgi:NinB protein